MKKVVPFILLSATMVGGCATYSSDFYDPYSLSSAESRYYNAWPMYYSMPYAYYRSCGGLYGWDGRCYTPYSLPQAQSPAEPAGEDPVIPLTQPPIMATDGLPILWHDVGRGETAPRQLRAGPDGMLDWSSVRFREANGPSRPSYTMRHRSDPPSSYAGGSRYTSRSVSARNSPRASSSRPSGSRSASRSSGRSSSAYRSAPGTRSSSKEQIR